MPIDNGFRGQTFQTPLRDFSGTITAGGTAQLVLPRIVGRVYLLVQNISSGPMAIGIGHPTATATITSGGVSSVAVNNAGMGFTYPPLVSFLGGARFGTSGTANSFVDGVGGGIGFPNPTVQASAHAVMTGSAGNLSVSSIVMDNIGSGYISAPYVVLTNDPRDPYGCTTPSASSGIQLSSGSAPFIQENSVVTTDTVAIWGATTGQAFTCKVVYSQ